MTWSQQGSRVRTRTREHRARQQRVFARDNYQCQIRGPRCNGRAEHLDHKTNTRGPHYDTDDNCQAACRPCNQWKAAYEGHHASAAHRAKLRLPTERHPGLRPTREPRSATLPGG